MNLDNIKVVAFNCVWQCVDYPNWYCTHGSIWNRIRESVLLSIEESIDDFVIILVEDEIQSKYESN
jgi:hypothetical protein